MFRGTHGILMPTTENYSLSGFLSWFLQLTLSIITEIKAYLSKLPSTFSPWRIMTNKQLRKHSAIQNELDAFRTWQLHIFPPHGGTPVFNTLTQKEKAFWVPRQATFGLVPEVQRPFKHSPQVLQHVPLAQTSGAERCIWGSHKSGSWPSAVTKAVRQTPIHRIPSLFPSMTLWCPLLMETYIILRH